MVLLGCLHCLNSGLPEIMEFLQNNTKVLEVDFGVAPSMHILVPTCQLYDVAMYFLEKV